MPSGYRSSKITERVSEVPHMVHRHDRRRDGEGPHQGKHNISVTRLNKIAYALGVSTTALLEP